MRLIGTDYLMSGLSRPGFSCKLVVNAAGAIFFPVASQHRDNKAEGISYEDNYKGNAMAAMVGRGTIEIRYHSAFTDRDVTRIMARLLGRPELAAISQWSVTYQGRPLAVERP